jgi:hypothetical protein
MTNPQHLYHIYRYARERALWFIDGCSLEYCSYLLYEDGRESLNEIIEILSNLELSASELLGTIDIAGFAPYFRSAFRSSYLFEIRERYFSDVKQHIGVGMDNFMQTKVME